MQPSARSSTMDVWTALFENGRFPMADAVDEIGDLARSFEKLFEVVGSYTDYLRTLASKLSHELNTPLAIVKSSLDNLEHASMAPKLSHTSRAPATAWRDSARW
jgi:signal transduction histidine kinase